VYAPYHGAGLVIWQNPENYVRLEIAAGIQHGKGSTAGVTSSVPKDTLTLTSG
jgi:hypothetical protein